MANNGLITTYRSTVYNTADPEGRNRVQLVVPNVFGPNVVTGWVWPTSPNVPAPAVGSLVYAVFENGDPNNPLYLSQSTAGLAVAAASGVGVLSLGGSGTALGTGASGSGVLSLSGLAVVNSEPLGAKVWAPMDSGLLASSSDPQYIPGGNLLSAGVIQLVQLQFPRGGTVANLLYGVQTAASGATSAQCWIGLYNSAGTLICNAVDQTTNFGVTNDHTVAITVRGGQSLTIAPGGVAYVALLSNASTSQVSLWSPGTQSTAANINLAAGSYRYCQSGSAQSVLPTSITLASTTRTRAYYAAAS